MDGPLSWKRPQKVHVSDFQSLKSEVAIRTIKTEGSLVMMEADLDI